MDLSEIALPDEAILTWNRREESKDDDTDDPFSESTESEYSSSLTPVLVLYGDFSDRVFLQCIQRLRTVWMMNIQGDGDLRPPMLRVIVRHVAKASTLSTSSHFLQGYGVALDIRNVEYKVFDDVNDSGDDDSSKVERYIEWNENLTTSLPEDDFLAGVRIDKLNKMNDDATGKNETMFGLWKRHDDQNRYSQIVPPNWQRRRLSLQAATVIAAATQSGDTLWELLEVSQNLPSLAGTLVHVPVPESIARAGAATSSSVAAGRIYFHQGRRTIHGDRPSFNVFEYLEILKSEQRTLDSIQRKFQNVFPNNRTMGLYQIQQAWMQGSRFWEPTIAGEEAEMVAADSSAVYRIDVGRGWKQAVLYLNDVESDLQYAQWTRSVRQMLMSSLQFGMPPSIRRNLFTILAVVDLETCDGNHNGGLQLGWQLVQNSYPARIGILMVSETDLQSCSHWSAQNAKNDACPSPPLFHDIVPKSIQDLKSIPATSHAVHRLMTRFAQEYDDHRQPGALLAYVEYLFSYLHQPRDTSSPSLSMYDLVSIHGNLLEGMRLSSSDEGEQEAFDFLVEKEDESGPFVYGKALRFALDKGLKPGMSFLNGRPLPKEEDSSAINTMFTQEQNHIFGMIMRGKITDSSPKSVYAKLLTGNRVFPRNHPLLLGNDNHESGVKAHTDYFDDNSLVDVSHDNAWLHADSFASEAQAQFVVDAFLEFGTNYGRSIVSTFLSGIADDSFPTALESSTTASGEGGDGSNADNMIAVGSVYRIRPASPSAAENALCPIFAHASLFGGLRLKELMTWLAMKTEEEDFSVNIDTLLDELNATDEIRATIASTLTAKDAYCSKKFFSSTMLPFVGNTIIANGRHYSLEENSSFGKGDLELLLSLELDRAKAVTALVRQQKVAFQSPRDSEKVARIATFLAMEAATDSSSRDGARAALHDTIEQVQSFRSEVGTKEEYPLLFSWNQPTFSDDEMLQVEVTAVIDPTTEAAQRLSPLLLAIRDQLKLPLQLILTPTPVLDNDEKVPITTYYRLVADPNALLENSEPPRAVFSNLPSNHVLTLKLDVPEPWNVQQTFAVQDTDNLRCDIRTGCGDEAHRKKEKSKKVPFHEQKHVSHVEYGLKNLLIFGQCYETSKSSPPNGLQLTLTRALSKDQSPSPQQHSVEIRADGSLSTSENLDDSVLASSVRSMYSDTLVMKNVGYWQLRADAGVWDLSISKDSRGSEIFEMVDGSVKNGRIVVRNELPRSRKRIVLKDFVSKGELLLVRRRPGYETASLFHDEAADATSAVSQSREESEEMINVFSLATGHLYERFLKIMMLSVTKRTSSKVKFWFFENFLSPTFKSSAQAMAEQIGCELEFVTYKWPEWLRGQSEKQRIIWGYKILFLDVLFPLHVKKIIYVDADQGMYKFTNRKRSV
jgi:hypothetical protein